MKLKDFKYDPFSITPKYPVYPEYMKDQIRNIPNDKGELYVMDYIENKTPRIFDGYDQIKVRSTKGSLKSIRKKDDFTPRKAIFGSIKVIDRKGYEHSNEMHEEMLIRAMFRHLVLNVFHVPFNKKNISRLDEIPFSLVKNYVGRYYPSNLLWLVSTVSLSKVYHNHDIEPTADLSIATSSYSSIRRQQNLTDSFTKEPVKLRKGYREAPHREDEIDEMYQVHCFEHAGYKTKDDEVHAFKPIPMFRKGYFDKESEFQESIETDDVMSFFDPKKRKINPGEQSLM